MTSKNQPKRVWRKVERPNLRWAEAILGESLQAVPEAPRFGAARPQRDASVIPMGAHCYQPSTPDYTPCRYFHRTTHGTVRCVYLGVEAFDSGDSYAQRHKVDRYFGSAAKAKAAGVANMFELPDSTKICGVSLLYPSYVEHHLEPAIEDYERSVKGYQVMPSVYWSADYAHLPREEARRRSAAAARFEVWQTLCSMVEDVPLALIERIQQTDALFRGATEPSNDPTDMGCQLPAHPEPKRQFWYAWRKDFSDAWLGLRDVCWLKNVKGAVLTVEMFMPGYPGPGDSRTP